MNFGTELIKIVDFGIAKVKDSVIAPSTANNVSIGTVLYMSPEQLRGGERITAASDIYSMAVIAYEMLTGRRPFNPASAPQLLEMHRAGVRVNPIDLRTNLSTEAQAMILRGLSFEPTDRYQSASEFGNSLHLALTSETPKAPVVRPSTVPQNLITTIRNDTAIPTQRTKRTKLAIVALVLLLMIAFTGVFLYTKSRVGPGNPQTHSFIYSLTVQRMRDNKTYQEPFQSTGQDIFENGDKFRLNLSSSTPGYLYLFNEGPPKPDGSSFSILYPTPTTNNGSATLGANQWVQTNWNTFVGQTGTENFWIIWSTKPVYELENAKTEAFRHPTGSLSGGSLDKVKALLLNTEEEVKTRITRDKSSQQTTVRGAGEMLVRMVQLQHR